MKHIVTLVMKVVFLLCLKNSAAPLREGPLLEKCEHPEEQTVLLQSAVTAQGFVNKALFIHLVCFILFVLTIEMLRELVWSKCVSPPTLPPREASQKIAPV